VQPPRQGGVVLGQGQQVALEQDLAGGGQLDAAAGQLQAQLVAQLDLAVEAGLDQKVRHLLGAVQLGPALQHTQAHLQGGTGAGRDGSHRVVEQPVELQGVVVLAHLQQQVGQRAQHQRLDPRRVIEGGEEVGAEADAEIHHRGQRLGVNGWARAGTAVDHQGRPGRHRQVVEELRQLQVQAQSECAARRLGQVGHPAQPAERR
jgi:hypothetical protein